MNYAGFCRPVWFWLDRYVAWPRGSAEEVVSATPWPTEAFVETLDSFRAPLPWKIAMQQFNLLDSHDTARIMNVMGGDVSKVKLAVGLLFTYPGVPCVYYGDEIGLSGDSHHNRGTMPWYPQRWNMDLRSYYQKLIRLRRESSALKVGGFQWMAIGKDEFSFLRESSAEWLICWASRNSSERPAESIDVSRGGIPDGTIFTEFFTRQTAVVTNGSLTIRLPDQNFSIWIAPRQTE
jgi:alpha-glucosidase